MAAWEMECRTEPRGRPVQTVSLCRCRTCLVCFAFMIYFGVLIKFIRSVDVSRHICPLKLFSATFFTFFCLSRCFEEQTAMAIVGPWIGGYCCVKNDVHYFLSSWSDTELLPPPARGFSPL